MARVLDCDKEPLKKGCIVSFNAKLEDGSIKRLCGEIISIYRDPSLLLCVAIDDETCCIIPPRHVSIVLPTETVDEDSLLVNPYGWAVMDNKIHYLPAYPLKKY